MGLFKRAADLVESQVNKFLDRIEDPNAMLDLSYEKMVTALQEVKRHLADVVTEMKQLEFQIGAAEKDIEGREEDARNALRAGREDLAKAALERKQTAVSRREALVSAHARIAEQVDRLKAAEQRYQERIESFRTQKEVTKATYNAAQAEVRMGEHMAGISKGMSGVGDTIKRATDKADQMAARASALEHLADEGILDDPFDHRDRVTKELDEVRKQFAVEDDLARLKREVEEGK